MSATSYVLSVDAIRMERAEAKYWCRPWQRCLADAIRMERAEAKEKDFEEKAFQADAIRMERAEAKCESPSPRRHGG